MLPICQLNIPLSSPPTDERALVLGAAQFGYVFATRTPTRVEVVTPTGREVFEVLNVIDFTSTRKRMSVIVRNEAGEWAFRMPCD